MNDILIPFKWGSTEDFTMSNWTSFIEELTQYLRNRPPFVPIKKYTWQDPTPIKDEVKITFTESIIKVDEIWNEGRIFIQVIMKDGWNYKGEYDDSFSVVSKKCENDGFNLWFQSPVFTDPKWNRKDYWMYDIERFNHDIYMIDLQISVLRLYQKHNSNVFLDQRMINWKCPITRWH